MKAKRVFFVEDDEQDLSLIKLYLNLDHDNTQVEFIDNSSEVLKHFAKGYFPDIVFLDLNIPSINGKELMEKVGKLYPDNKTIFFIFTSSQRNQDIKDCYKLGIGGYFIKPYDLELFKEIVQMFNLIIKNMENLCTA